MFQFYPLEVFRLLLDHSLLLRRMQQVVLLLMLEVHMTGSRLRIVINGEVLVQMRTLVLTLVPPLQTNL